LPKTRLISPGIANHSLKKNLILNDNYISNDGGDEGIRISDSGDVGVGTVVAPLSNFEVFNQNVQYSTGTAYQASGNIVGSGTTFTAAMVGGRFIFDDGTDAGVITGFAVSTVITVSTSQTVGADGDWRSYKIYYPSVQIDTGASSTSLKIGNMALSKDEIDLSTQGNFTVDAVGDIALSADGGNITMNDGTVEVFDFDVDGAALTIYDDADTDGARDYYKIVVAANGQTSITTNDDSGGGMASLTYDIDGYISYQADYLSLTATTKTASGTNDTTLRMLETLNLSSGAGGSDVHYGIKYTQTQTDLTGWDSVYLMYLYGGDAARTFAVQADGKVGIGVADPDTTLEILSTSAQQKWSYDGDSFATIGVGSDSTTSITAAESGNVQLYGNNIVFGTNAGGNHTAFSISSSGSKWTSSGGQAYIDANGDIKLDASTGIFHFYDAGDDADAFKMTVVGGTGATTLETVSAAADGHLSIVADGHVEFDNCAVGFDRLEQTFSVTDVIASAGTDDTDIDFRLSNKYRLEMTGDIAQMNLIFPNTSGNFLLVCNTDGDHDVALWKVWEHDSAIGSTNAAAVTDVMWAGGSLPAFTDTGNDIVSFYWDADEQTAYGVASLAFAIPS